MTRIAITEAENGWLVTLTFPDQPTKMFVAKNRKELHSALDDALDDASVAAQDRTKQATHESEELEAQAIRSRLRERVKAGHRVRDTGSDRGNEEST